MHLLDVMLMLGNAWMLRCAQHDTVLWVSVTVFTGRDAGACDGPHEVSS